MVLKVSLKEISNVPKSKESKKDGKYHSWILELKSLHVILSSIKHKFSQISITLLCDVILLNIYSTYCKQNHLSASEFEQNSTLNFNCLLSPKVTFATYFLRKATKDKVCSYKNGLQFLHLHQ